MAKIKNSLPMTVEWKGPNGREFYLDDQIKKNNWTVGAEIGVRFGRTLFYLLDNNPRLQMYAVDIDISQFYSSQIKEKYGDRIIVLEGDSSTVAENILTKLDFVFIDGAHSYKAVMKDLTAYAPKVKQKCGLLGHDIDYPSIQKALKDFSIDYEVGPDNVWQQKV